MLNIKAVLLLLIRIFLGGMLLWGGVQKFQKPIPSPQEVVEKVEKYSSNENILQKILYISGAKQTGYFWQLLGVSELLFGLLIIVPKTRLVGALLAAPITLNILMFHLFLEIDDIPELILTGSMLMANLIILFADYKLMLNFVWLKDRSGLITIH